MTKLVLLVAEGLLGPDPFFPILRFTEGSSHGGAQPRQALLQDIVRRALLDGLNRHFFAEDRGDENEGHVGTCVPGQIHRGDAVERRERVVGQNEVEAALPQRGQKVLSVIHVDRLELEPVLGEHLLDQLSVGLAVFEMQDPDRFLRW